MKYDHSLPVCIHCIRFLVPLLALLISQGIGWSCQLQFPSLPCLPLAKRGWGKALEGKRRKGETGILGLMSWFQGAFLYIHLLMNSSSFFGVRCPAALSVVWRGERGVEGASCQCICLDCSHLFPFSGFAVAKINSLCWIAWPGLCLPAQTLANIQIKAVQKQACFLYSDISCLLVGAWG